MGEVIEVRRWKVGSSKWDGSRPGDQETTKNVGAMAEWGFDVPMFRRCPSSQCSPALVLDNAVCSPDVIAFAVAGVDRVGCWDAQFTEDRQVNLVDCEDPTGLGKPTIAAVLDVVCCEADIGGGGQRGRWFGLSYGAWSTIVDSSHGRCRRLGWG